MRMPEKSTFTVGIVIPVFRHSHLLVEAIECVLAQTYEPAPQIVIVNDGCPQPETHFIAESYARSRPDRVSYLYKTNGGLSSARNAGIDYLLEKDPSLGSVYLLDADNRLEPSAIAKFVSALTDSGAGWAYPDIDQFGLQGSTGYSGDYRLCMHLDRNICEAGSLISGDLLRTGLRFDETMLKGFEDWEFWLAAAERGFRGVHVSNAGFGYRKRPSSMLSESQTHEDSILEYIKSKHKKLFDTRNVKRIVSEEAPSLAVVDLAEEQVLIGEDPLVPERVISIADFQDEIWRALDRPDMFSAPLQVVFSRRSLAGDEMRPFLRGLIFHLLNSHGDSEFKLIRLDPAAGENQATALGDIAKTTPAAVAHDGDFLCLSMRTVAGVLRADSLSWIFTMLNGNDATLTAQKFSLSSPLPPAMSVPLTVGVFGFLSRMKDVERAASVRAPWSWRDSDVDLLWVDRFGGSVPSGSHGFPLKPSEERRSIAFVLPIMDFGGVEKVTAQVGRVFKDAGWHVSFFIFGGDKISMALDQLSFADDITILGTMDFPQWTSPKRYMGEVIPMASGALNSVVAAFQYFDCVANCHSWAFNQVMAGLKAKGVLTCAYVHLFDETPYGRHAGHIPVTLAFEHTYRYIVTCSHTLARQMEALGVPSSKVIAVQNAPSYRVTDLSEELQLPATPREFSDSHRPRLLFLGRLDRQKGLSRLTTLYDQTRDFCDWRFVGKAILQQSGPTLAAGISVEPPVYQPDEIEQLYRWADFFILMSDFEGLPLALLEAMRAGAIPIVTDVGANREVVRHGENGFLVSPQHAAREAQAILGNVQDDPDRMHAISAAAMADMKEKTWPVQAEPFLRALENHFARPRSTGNGQAA